MTDTLDQTTESPPVYAADFIHELFWEQIKRLFSEELIAAGSKMGSVSAVQATNLLVLVDGSSSPRSMPRIAGRSWSVGQRVIVANIQGRQVVVAGVLTGADGELVISAAQLAPGAVKAALDRDNVSLIPPPRSVTGGMIATGTLVGSGSVNQGQSLFAQNTISSYELAPGSVTNGKIEDPSFSPGGAYRSGGIHGNKLIPGTVTTDHIASLNANKLFGTIDGGMISQNSIQGGQIMNGSLGLADFQADFKITGNQMEEATIKYSKLDQNIRTKIENACKAAGIGKKCKAPATDLNGNPLGIEGNDNN
jgi:hypothetical protein